MAASIVYSNDKGKEEAEKNGWRIIPDGIYEDHSNDTRIVLYEDSKNKKMIVAVKGTDSLKFAATVDAEIAFGLTMKSIENPQCQEFLKKIDRFKDDGYHVVTAAHSGGASQAGVISSKYNYRRLCSIIQVCQRDVTTSAKL